MTKWVVRRTFLLVALVVGVLGFAGGGCATSSRGLEAAQLPSGAFAVPGNQAWTVTGLTAKSGQKLLIEEVVGSKVFLVKNSRLQEVSARGTYLFDAESGHYPIEPERAHDDRRYPGYSLIGRIGPDGTPFFVGERFQGVAPESGPLWLGINDPAPARNRGAFHCRIALDYPGPPLPPPAATEAETRAAALARPVPPLTSLAGPKPPELPAAVPDANVVIFFIDGLRPDVAVEMAQWGHMPNFRKLFLENGAWVRNSFTVLPSLTLTSFSSMITGDYSNRHGVKMQCFYDRNAGAYINGITDRFFTRFAGEVKARGVKAIWDYFPDSFASTVIPYEPLKPDVLQMNLSEWFHRAVNTADYSSNIRDQMDEVQTRFALDLASSPKVKAMMVYLSRNDTVSEKTRHGQFGGDRPTIVRMDACLGRIVERFKVRHRFEKTYFILVSDHGHSGGHEIINRRFDVKREVFHAHLQMSVIDAFNGFDYPGAPAGRRGAISDFDGAAGIFLPVGNVDSGNLKIPNTYEQLAHYGLADGSRVNAVELFAEFSSTGRWRLKDTTDRPVDFAVAKVDADTVLIHKTSDRQALIRSRRNADGVLEFKYEPVRGFAPGLPLEPLAAGDPLGYLDSPAFRKEVGDVSAWLKDYHTGTEWLFASCATDYPACVDSLSYYFRWDGPVTRDSPVPSQPDILLFASRGWAFEPKINLADQYQEVLGSKHGMAFREATNNSFFFSGPGIRKGAIIDMPHRMVDLMPTVLHMMGRDAASAGMDGRAVREIWEGVP